MQPLPHNFLKNIAKDYGLTPNQTDALVKRLGDRDNELTDAESLGISASALRSRMTDVYKKFRIQWDGPNKLEPLHDLLFQKYQALQTGLSNSQELTSEIDALVKQIRHQVHEDILHRCGTMRVLDMEQPIGVGDIYTSVNILEKLSGRRRLGINELWEGCELENFDRLLLGKVKQERIPGLEAVERYDKLMILGKPGAGKTTFMKRLATLCNQGKFLANHVPVFITLKEFAEAENRPSLPSYIAILND